jgi:hypothetical protein
MSGFDLSTSAKKRSGNVSLIFDGSMIYQSTRRTDEVSGLS